MTNKEMKPQNIFNVIVRFLQTKDKEFLRIQNLFLAESAYSSVLEKYTLLKSIDQELYSDLYYQYYKEILDQGVLF